MNRFLAIAALLLWLPMMSAQANPGEPAFVQQIRERAEQGDPEGQFHMGVLYDQGEGVTASATEAVRWYQRAADQGHMHAQLNLGFMYRKGEGVPRDVVEAYFWLELAAAQGEKNAEIARGLLEKQMTSGQIAEAQRRAAVWEPKLEK